MDTITAPGYAPTDRPLRPRAMNRQVGPSIVLSVLIVCFFAVALFQHDPPRSRSRAIWWQSRDRSIRSVLAARPELLDRGPDRSRSRRAASARREIELGRSARPLILRSSPINRCRLIFLGRPAHPDWIGRGPERAERIEVSRRPGSAFTVVEANETLQDVAVRVYGSRPGRLALESQSRCPISRDAPLAAGTVLRTPIVDNAQSPLRK